MAAGEQPAEMGLAGGAEHDLPVIAWKPGEFAGRFAVRGNPGCLPKTADGKGDSSGIEESVFVPIVHLQCLIAVGDNGAADRANNGVIGLMVPGVTRAGGRRAGGL